MIRWPLISIQLIRGDYEGKWHLACSKDVLYFGVLLAFRILTRMREAIPGEHPEAIAFEVKDGDRRQK